MIARARFVRHFSFSLLVLCFVLISCAQTAPTSKATPQSLPSVQTWIQQNAHLLQTTEPGSANTDLQPLKQMVGDATIVGLGEANHGTHEFFTMKQRIFEFLVEQMGFTTFAFENGWDASRQIDNYILTGNGNLDALMRNDLYAAWQTEEVRNLIEWMRAYDADPTHTTKVHFVGIDAWNISQQVFDDVVNYIQAVDPEQTVQVQTLYTGIRPASPIPDFVDYDGFSANPQSTKQHYQANAQQVYDLLKSHQSIYESRSSSSGFALALQEAQVIVQYTTLGVLIPSSETLFTSEDAYAKRDQFMADNVAWWHDYSGANAGIVVWAHNTHIAKLRQPAKSMGEFLYEKYQGSYRPIGTSFFQGSFRIFGGGSTQVFTAPTPAADTYNYALGSVGFPRYLLDIRQAPAGPVQAWLQGPYTLLNYGVGGQDLETDGSLQYWFDVIVALQSITPSHLLN
jgi:erythromycin esterase